MTGSAAESRRSGFVAILGKPNVGKSTLLNRLVGTRVAIVSARPQTTRRRILGILHGPHYQAVFVDTPGFYRAPHRLGEYMLRTARTEGSEADVVLFVTELTHLPTAEDREVAEFLRSVSAPILLVANKCDRVRPPEEMLPRLQAYSALGEFREVFPLSATRGDNVAELLASVVELLPPGPPYFPPEQVTDQNDRIFVEEVIREKVLMKTGQEVPHAVAVQVEEMDAERRSACLYLRAVIYVEKPGQKKIVIGKGGEKIKTIGRLAREELELRFGRKIYLDLWVRVKTRWRDREDWLRSLGYS